MNDGHGRAPRHLTAGLLAALLLAAGCREPRETPPSALPIVRVELRLVPEAGRAWAVVESSGTVKGGHLSGDDPPFVHLDSIRIPPDSVQAIFAAVRALGDTLLARRGPSVDSSRRGTATLAITFGDSTEVQFVWGSGARPDDPRVEAVVTHLLANRTGGW